MSDKNNPQSVSLKSYLANNNAVPLNVTDESIKKTISLSINDETTPPASKTPSIYTLKILNDNLVNPLNKDEFQDGGKTSQLYLGGSWLINKGLLKNASLAAGTSATTTTGWPGISNDREPIATQGVIAGKPIIDGLQNPNGENYAITTAINRTLDLKNKNQITFGGRTDFVSVSSKLNFQNEWHGGFNGADYVLNQSNTIKSQKFINTEFTAAYHALKEKPQTHRDITVMAGLAQATGNAYSGVMAGAEWSIGSKSSKYLPRMSHSAQYGNTDLDHVIAGGAPESGAWRFSAYAKIYYTPNNDHDYRLNMSAQSHEPQIGTAKFDDAFIQKYSSGTYTKTVNGNSVTTPMIFTVDHPTQLDFSLPSPVSHYNFKPLNAQLGIQGAYQRGHVNVKAKIELATNAAIPVLDPLYQQELDRIRDFYVGQKYTSKTDPSIFHYEDTSSVTARSSAYFARINAEKALKESPTATFNGEIAISYSIGAHKKNSSHAK